MTTASIFVLCMVCVVHTARVKVQSVVQGWGKCSDFSKEGPQSPSKSSGNDAPQSCMEAWRENKPFYARCAWIDDDLKCVPNCLLQENQDAEFCEGPFCVWDAEASSCSFNPSMNKARRAFCDRVAGKFDRRLVDKTGNQVDFYDHNLVKDVGFGDGKKSKTSNRKIFCRDMLGDGDDEYVDMDANPEDVLLGGAVRCWRPNPANRASYRDPVVQELMKAEFKQASDPVDRGVYEMTPVLMKRPLGGVLRSFNHWIVGLTNVFTGNEGLSTCLDYKYTDAGANEALDHAGCNFFKASFKPLQELHKCMMPLIQEDPYKQLWNKVAEASRENQTKVAVIAEKLSADGHIQWLTQQLPGEHMDLSVLLQQWRDCEKNSACNGWLDEYERAVEIIKQIEQDSWEGLDIFGVRELVQSRLVSTLATPVDSLAPALSPGTVNTITDKCFKLQIDAALESPADAPTTALLLKESLRCMPLMWDGVNVPGAPLTALWPSRWETPVAKFEAQKHPVCARMAVAALLRSFSRTKYPYGWKILRLKSLNDKHCLTLTGANCINFKDCFSVYLEKYAGAVGDFCAPHPTCCCKSATSSPANKSNLYRYFPPKKESKPQGLEAKSGHPPEEVAEGQKEDVSKPLELTSHPLESDEESDNYEIDEILINEDPMGQSMIWTEVEVDAIEDPKSDVSNWCGSEPCCEFQQDGCAKGFHEAEREFCLQDSG